MNLFGQSPLELYSRRITAPGGRRNGFGELVEYFAAEALGAERTGVYTEALCPDLRMGRLSVEVKASKAGAWVIYPWRIGREVAYEEQTKSPYLYALLQYKAVPVPIGHTLTVASLKECHIFLGTLREVKALCEPLPLRTIKNTKEGVGYHREGYKEGYVELRKPAWPLTREHQVCGVPCFHHTSEGAAVLI